MTIKTYRRLIVALIMIIALGLSHSSPKAATAVSDYTFTNVTNAAGVGNDIVGRHFGATWSDYDKDGLLDLYVVNCSPNNAPTSEGANTLYRNNGDGTFTDVTEETQGGDPYCAMRNVWADYDKDGDLDFYSHNFDQSTLYQNNGNVFTDVNASSGAGLNMPWGTGAAWADYDNDGYLDLHATAFPGENALLHNNGDGTFTDLRASAGFPLAASGMGDAWADYNNDGFQDLAIAAVTDQDTAILYLNNGDGTFTDVTVDAGIIIEPGGSGFSVLWLDYDDDGWFDLIFTEGELGSAKGLPIRVYLFRNKADGTFEDVTFDAGLTVPSDFTTIREASWADYDNDGDSDIYLGGITTDMFFRNNGDGTFTNIAPELGLDRSEDTFGAIWADYDQDGDLDLYVVYLQTPNMLFENQGGPNNWLQIELIGTTGNFDAIGARVKVTAGSKTQVQEINGGTGLFSQHSPIQHFGLGGAELANVEIRWPSGQVDILSDVSVNQVVTVTEQSVAVTCGGKPATIVGTPGDDILIGTNGPDVIAGLDGHDVIVGLAGNDRLCGGPGHDYLIGGSGRDRLLGQGGNDMIGGGSGNDVILAGPGNDKIQGGAGNDTIACGGGADIADGGTGTDTAAGCEFTIRVPGGFTISGVLLWPPWISRLLAYERAWDAGFVHPDSLTSTRHLPHRTLRGLAYQP